jgi:hypothetical protein
MSIIGECRIEENKIYLDKDYDDETKIRLYIIPNCSMRSELRDGDKIELRVHRDFKKDSSVLFDGKLTNLDKGKYGWIYELEQPVRERLDHRGSYNFWQTFEDGEGKGDLTPDPILGEWLEVRVHVIERAQ